ncbi:MAG: N-methyl-L-tryptophan oxidase [Anaerolineales bacterium]|nr:N-methyl-L-tryptophan oxidase [Anaerolineales bacterium]
MSKATYDYIILGCGGIGSGAAYWLARRAGGEVLGLEQFPLGHPHGGSQDHSRIIRLTYHHADYTRLTPYTYSAWATLEEESGVKVVYKTGSVELAYKDGPHMRELEIYASAMDAAGIPYERFDGDELMRRYPQFRLSRDVAVLWQADTGLVDAAKGNAAHVATARLYGATILDQCPVTGLHPFDGGVDVHTERGTFTCRKLIITAGAWVDEVLAWVGQTLRITVTQEQVTYYATPHLRDFAIGRFPIWIVHDDHVLYGFPVYGEVATKAAIDAAGPVVTARTRTYDADPVRERLIEDWLRENLPTFLGPKLYTKTCLYDMPRDRNFVIDALPGHPQILVCNGAGHAYKFASLLGQILSELAINGHTQYPIAPFTLNRPAITDPNFPAVFHI